MGVTVEPELLERLVADAASEPGILPFLQETLVQLWDATRRHSCRMRADVAMSRGNAGRAGKNGTPSKGAAAAKYGTDAASRRTLR